MKIINNLISFVKREKWVEIEIFNLRAGGMIRVTRDKVQRRTNKDLSQYYYLQDAKETLEPQEFEDIYVGSKGEEVLKLFSPTKGVYLPIRFMFNKIRDLTDEEQKKIDDIEYTEAEKIELKVIDDDEKLKPKQKQQKKKTLKEKIDKRIEKERKIMRRKLYSDIYKTQFESNLDTDTLNHLVYKVQKNALRLQGGGLDLATKITLLIVFMIIASVIQSWLIYNYFLKPGMEFWNDNSADVIKAKELNVEQAKLETGYYEKYEPEKIPVEPVAVK